MKSFFDSLWYVAIVFALGLSYGISAVTERNWVHLALCIIWIMLAGLSLARWQARK